MAAARSPCPRAARAAAICAARRSASSLAAATSWRTAITLCRACFRALAGGRSRARRVGRNGRQRTGRQRLAQSQPLLLGGQARLQRADFLFEFAHLTLQRGDPRLLLAKGLDPGGLTPERLVDRQPRRLLDELLALLLQELSLLLELARSGIDRIEPLDRALGNRPQGAQRGQLIVQGGPLRPSRSQADGQFDDAGFRFDPAVFFLEPGRFAIELGSRCRQAIVLMGCLAEIFDFRTKLFALVQQLRDLATSALAIEDAVARGLQRPHDLDERDPVQAGGEAVEHLGRFRVAQRAQFLQFAQPDGEHVVVDRLVDVRQQGLDQVLALPGAVGRRKRQPLGTAGRAILVVVAVEVESAVGTGHVERPARPAAVDRRKILPPRGREAVEHRADEVQQGRLAGFVRPVEHVQTVGETLELQSAPHAVAVDFQTGDLHDGSSSPLNRSTPNRAAACNTRWRAALSASVAADPNAPARCCSAIISSSSSGSSGLA